MSFSIIAAIGQNNELGVDNHLIWNLKEDLKYFKEVTNGSKIIMGRKTFESLGRLLPNREHIVLSTNNMNIENVKTYKTMVELIRNYYKMDEEIFIIGGAKVYKEFINIANKLYLTEIEKSYNDADTYFPCFDKDKFNKNIINEKVENDIPYKTLVYTRK